MILWVDWAWMGCTSAPQEIDWGSMGLEHPRQFTLQAYSWCWFLATSLAKNAEQNAQVQIHVIWATCQYGRWFSKGSNLRANVERKKQRQRRERMTGHHSWHTLLIKAVIGSAQVQGDGEIGTLSEFVAIFPVYNLCLLISRKGKAASWELGWDKDGGRTRDSSDTS